MAYDSANHHKYTVDNRLYQQFLEAFLHRLFDVLQKTRPRTVLCAGCGEGYVVSYLAQQNPELQLTAVDRDREALAFARRHYGEKAHFQHGNVYDLPFPDSTFDTVLCSEVLEHLEHPGRALSELRRVAGKHVVLTVPREPYFRCLNGLARLLGWAPDPGHVNFWTRQSFQRFVNEHLEKPSFAQKHIFQLAWGAV